MKSLQEYIELYRGVARRLNLQGDSIEMLSQLLGNATYISEVEHISYTQEASLERASQLNSKIQHCMNEMYSVFRGSCPRVLIHFTSLSYLEYKLFDEIATFNNFSLYYLGYHDLNSDEVGESPKITYAPVSIPPNQEMTIIALISPKKLLGEWTINYYNQFYVDFLESNLSNDIQVRVDGELYNTTRIFADHIKDSSLIFDLTLPDYGLRLYAPEIFKGSGINDSSEMPTGTKISLEAFRFSELSSYNTSELKQVKVKGTKLKEFDLTRWNSFGSELSDGLIFIKEVSRDSTGTIHYKAHKDRYTGSILRSNSDVGYLLEEMYPEKIKKSGTSYKFESTKIIPQTRTTFGFMPVDTSLGQVEVELAGNSESDPNSKTTLLVNSSNSSLLTVYSSESNPVKTYFNNNPSVNYSPEGSSNVSFAGTKLSLISPGLFKNGSAFGGIVRVPISGSGTLRVYHKASFNLATNAVYNIIPSNSIILRNDNSLLTKGLLVNITRSLNGITEVLSELEDNLRLQIIYKYIISDKISEERQNISNGINNIALSSSIIVNKKVSEVIINLLDSSDKILDAESIPVVYASPVESSSTTTSDVLSPLNISLSLSNDEIFLESNGSGDIITPFPITIQASVFSAGTEIKSGIIYSIEKTSGIQCDISSQGLLTITSIDSIKPVFSLIVKASYKGIIVTSIVTIKTLLSSDAFKSRSIVVSDDPTGLTSIQKIDSGLVGQLSEIEYTNRFGVDSLYLWLSGTPTIDIYLLEWIKDEELDYNSSQIYPKLIVYYIPNSNSSILTQQEIDNYINSRKSYFVTQNISVQRGRKIKVLVTLGVELYKNVSIDSEISEIFSKYSNLFHIDLEAKRNEITSSIGKISNVRSLNSLTFTYKTELGDEISLDKYNEIDFNATYFELDYKINSFITN